MKLAKRVTFIMVLFFLISFTVQIPAAITGIQNDYKFQQLKETASQKGYVRIILKLDVPDIESLTSISTSYRTGTLDQAYIQEAYNADLNLERAVALSCDSLLYRLNGYSYIINRTFSTLPFIALSVSADTLDRLSSFSEVQWITEDKAIPLPKEEIQTGENDVSIPMLQESTQIVGAPDAWNLGYTGQGWYVAVLDSGILRTHEMFQGKNIVEQCYSLGGDWYDSVNGGCPNGKTEMSGIGSATPYEPRFGHGTHVAGIAAGNNYNNHVGVAKGANIIAVQIFSYFPSENNVLSWFSDQIKGLEYVYSLRNTYKIASVNMSLGGERYYDYCDSDARAYAITNLRNAGIATIVASGNEGYCGAIGTPACISSAVAVAGSTKLDTDYTMANLHDTMVKLLAPATSINSATSTGDTNYENLSGTSMATPHVTGAWAIIKEYDENMTIDEITSLLQETGTYIANSRCATVSPKSRISVGNALSTLISLAPPKNIAAEQVSNRALLRIEYINKITWESNPLNQGKVVSFYKIYRTQDNQLTLISQVDGSTFSYLHRNVTRNENITYAISAVDDQGKESLPAYYILSF